MSGVDLVGVKALGHIARQHPGDLAQITHILQLLQLLQIIRKRQPVFPQLLLQLLCLLLIVLLLRLLNKGQHIAHTQNAGGHAVGMEQFDHIQLLAGTHKFDGLSGSRPDGQGRTAAGVAVQLGQHHAVNAQCIVESLGGIHRVLTGHGVHHQQDLIGLHGGLDVPQLVHQRLVDMQTAGGIQKHHVIAVVSGVLHRFPGDGHGVDLPHFKHRDVQLLAHHLQLGNGGRTVHVAGRQQRALAELAAHQAGQLRAVGGFTGALQAHHHDHRGPAVGSRDLGVGTAHQFGQFLVDDLDDLLGGCQALQHVAAHAALRHLGHKVLDYLVADVGFQQRQTHLTHAGANIRFRQAALAPQVLEYGI